MTWVLILIVILLLISPRSGEPIKIKKKIKITNNVRF